MHSAEDFDGNDQVPPVSYKKRPFTRLLISTSILPFPLFLHSSMQDPWYYFNRFSGFFILTTSPSFGLAVSPFKLSSLDVFALPALFTSDTSEISLT